ncbi:hypothetical protein JW930_07400, partial [Candidatus Woesearchaeota archaeon]|nr:hypothetical protein [Candidatus Woesearchaeota archaeon]
MRKYCIIISACLLLLSLASADYVYITNIGVPGIGETNQNYTALRTVILNLEFMGSAINCRYINHDNNTDKPLDSDLNWSYPEPCVSLKYWLLSENDGNKTVYYQINYSGTLNTFNDSIYYYHNGTGLDITPPSAPLIIDGDYTNNNDSVSISWEEASDYESEILNIPLIYNYTLYDGTDSLASGTTLSTSFTASGLGREHGDNLTV